MTILQIPQLTMFQLVDAVRNAKSAFGTGPQETYNIDQTIITLHMLGGQTIPRKTLVAMLSVKFRGRDEGPAFMVSWFIKNEIIFVI
jgi:hypothetical protein